MAFLPANTDITVDRTQKDIETSKTYKIDWENGRITGYASEIEALNQAIIKLLSTERFKFLIYDENYGVEIHDLISKSYSQELIENEFERITKEALLEDERILEVKDFKFDFDSDSVNVSFTVSNVFGKELKIERRF